ncbi:MAG: hypothetical protein IIC49_04995 [Planctomycetes bacterium]|nr:hypothetical protein [Planctomycetota bacterium]
MTNAPDTPDPPATPPTPPISPTPPIPAAPPVIPGQIGPIERRSVWPIPIGIIVIVFSAWTLLWGSVAVIQGFTGSQFMGMQYMAVKSGVSETIAQIYSDAAPRFLVSGAGLMIAAALGLTGGIALLCRKRWSVLILRLWAVVHIIAAAVNAITQAMLHAQEMNAMWQSTAGGPPMAMTASMSIYNGVIGFILGAVLPIFVLIWFARPSIRADCGKW